MRRVKARRRRVMVWTVRLCWLLKVSTDKTDLLDFADRIGPGGKGLKRDREDGDSEDDDLDLDLDMSEEETDDDDDQEDEDAESTFNDIDPDDLLDDEPSDLDEADDESEGAEINLSEDEATSVKDDEDEEETTAVPTKYVPPHMRAAQLAEKAQGSKEKALSKQKLERKVQGLLNK
jgi:nucleolar MIF4G domain-containing protein 1